MQPERFELRADPEGLAAQLRARVPAPTSVHEAVAEIITGVRQGGDEALIAYTRRFDTAGTEPGPLQVSDDELDRAARALSSDVRRGLEQAVENVSRVAKAAPHASGPVRFDGHEVILREAAVRRAGVYVPGGRAPYPSTVVMGAVTARVAGVGDVVVGACQLAGVSSVYRMGGAQAIAALAYGTESVMPVDVIVGPGNLYVQEAKRQVFGQVGIDGFAGPSDLVLIASGEDGVDPAML